MIYTRINKGSVRLQTGMKDGQRGASDLADGVGEAQAGEGLGQAQNGQQRARGLCSCAAPAPCASSCRISAYTAATYSAHQAAHLLPL